MGNERGQVLVSVLTAAEGHGLDAMAAGLMKRYREAGEAAPKVMYVDRDCCTQHGQSRVKIMFSEWDELEVLEGDIQDGAEDGSRVARSGKTLQFFVCFICFFVVLRVRCC